MHISIPDVDPCQEFYQSFLTPEWISQRKKDLKRARKNPKAYNLDVFCKFVSIQLPVLEIQPWLQAPLVFSFLDIGQRIIDAKQAQNYEFNNTLH